MAAYDFAKVEQKWRQRWQELNYHHTDLSASGRKCYCLVMYPYPSGSKLHLGHWMSYAPPDAWARFRRMQGALLPNPPSRFLDEIPPELIEEISTEGVDEGFFDDWSVRDGGRASGSSAARTRRTARTPPPPKPTGPVQDHGDNYPIGGDVRHPSFGPGRILSREGSGKHLKLTIHFNDHGVKKILPSYTQLRVRAD